MAVIFVPGIQGSKLVDTYPVRFKVRWSLEDMVVGDLFEDPLDFELKDGLYDRSPEHLFREGEVLSYPYRRMVQRLRKWVDPRVYLFPYDWRKPVETAARRLVELMEHLSGKLRQGEAHPTLSFVTHSLGGLVLRSALQLRQPRPFSGIGRIVFVAPPFRGACDIVRLLIAGEKHGWLSDQEDFRKLARTFPSVYEMVPSFAGAAVSAGEGRDLDLFDPGHWQQNVSAGGLDHGLLLRARAFLGRGGPVQASPAPLLSELELKHNGDRILVLMSVGHPTVFQIPVRTSNRRNRNWFDFAAQQSDLYGDRRVHLKSAALPGVTLAAYRDALPHATVCRDQRVIASVCSWLQGHRLVKMCARTPRHGVRRSRSFFPRWDGREDSLPRHICPG